MAESVPSLSILVLIFAVLITSAVLWCLVSTCLGPPLLNAARGLFDSALLAGTGSRRDAAYRRRRELGGSEGEDWEMELMERRNRVG